jgi:hypothetical protein
MIYLAMKEVEELLLKKQVFLDLLGDKLPVFALSGN